MSKTKETKKDAIDYILVAFRKVKKSASSLFGDLKITRKLLLLMVIVAVVSISVTSLVSIMLSRVNDLYVPSLGVIKTIEVEIFWDENHENKIDAIDWGELAPGKTVDKPLFLKSVSNFDVTVNLLLTDWTPPEISDYITITWNYNGTILKPGNTIPVTMKLSTSSSSEFIDYLVENEVTNFNVTIHYVGTE